MEPVDKKHIMLWQWLGLLALLPVAGGAGDSHNALELVMNSEPTLRADFKFLTSVLLLMSDYRTATVATLGGGAAQQDASTLLTHIGNEASRTSITSINSNPPPVRSLPTEQEAHILVVEEPSQADRFFNDSMRYHPRGGFAVVVVPDYNSNISVDKALVAFLPLLERLWKNHRIPRVLVMNLQGTLLGFDPFTLSQESSRGAYRLITLAELFDDNADPLRMTNLHGYPLRLAVFQQNYTLKNVTLQYVNFRDEKFMDCVANAINAKVKRIISNDNQVSGNILENGSATGTLRMILNGEADLDYYARPLEYFGERQIEFAYPPIEYDHIVIALHNGEPINVVESVLISFSWNYWLLVLITYLGILFTSFLSNRLWKRNMHHLPVSIAEYNYGMPSGQFLRVTAQSDRIAITGALLASIVITTAWQAVFIRCLTNPLRLADIMNLKDLSESPEILSILVPPIIANQQFFPDKEDAVSVKLQKMLKVVDISKFLSRILNRRYALLVTESDFSYLLSDIPAVKSNFYTLNEHIQLNIYSYIAPYGSPFIPTISRVAHAITETGIANYWYMQYRKQQNELLKSSTSDIFIQKDLKPGLEQISGVLYFLITAHCICFIILVIEIIISKKQSHIVKRKQRARNKSQINCSTVYYVNYKCYPLRIK